MACGVCGDPGHNRRTHSAHEPVQGEALIDQPATGEPVAPAGADRAREALRAAREAPSMGSVPAGPLLWSATGEPVDPVLLRAVGRIADEMDVPHGPGCSLSEPCAECRRYVGESGPEQITLEQARQMWPDRVVVEGDGSWSVEAITVQGVHGPGASSVVPDEEDQPAPGTGWQDPATVEAASDLVRATLNGIGLGDHECEPAPDQVYFCRHCGADLDPEAINDGDHTGELIDVEPLDGLSVVYVDSGYPTPPWRTPLGPDEPIRITLPGVYQLEAHEYHDPAVTGDWVSNSDLRAMSAPHCPAKWKYNRDHGVRVTSDAFSFGHAWHSRVLGKGETIAVRPLVNPNDPDQVWDSWRTNAAKAWRAEQEAAGRSVILPEDWAVVEAMAAAIQEREEAARLLGQPGRPELAMFWVDPATGVKRRALVDFMPDRPNANGVLEIVDIKSTDSASPDDELERKIYKYGYFRQAVTIMDGAVALGLAEDATVFFIFQEKTAPYLVQEVELDVQAQLAGSIENHRALMVYKECMETDVWPAYSPATVTLSLPPYILARYEDEIEVSH